MALDIALLHSLRSQAVTGSAVSESPDVTMLLERLAPPPPLLSQLWSLSKVKTQRPSEAFYSATGASLVARDISSKAWQHSSSTWRWPSR